MSLPLRPLSELRLEAEKLGVDVSDRQLDVLLSSIETLVSGEILPCMSSPVRMRLLRAAAKGKLTSAGEVRSHAGRISDPAILQHLRLLSSAGLVRQEWRTVNPTELTSLFYPSFEPFAGSLAAFNEKQSSQMRCSILSRLAIAQHDDSPRPSLSLLADHCGVRKSTLFKHLKRLQSAGMVEGRHPRKWGAPYALTTEGKSFVDLVLKTSDAFGKLMLQVAARSNVPNLIVFSTSDSENVNLISIADKRVSLQLARRFYALLRPVSPKIDSG